MKRLSPIVIAMLIACGMPTLCRAEVIASGHALSIDPNSAAVLDACVKQTFDRMVSDSETSCQGQDHYFDSGNTDDNTNTINYSMGPDFPGYVYLPGTESTSYTGQCVFDMNGTHVDSGTLFVCTWHNAGCGFLKAGGHINGHCSVKIHYVPRSRDLVAIKEYCFGKLVGAPVSMPMTYQQGCVLP